MREAKLTLIAGAHQGMHWFAVGSILPVLTLIKTSQGLTLFQVGLSMALYSAVTILLEIPTGGLADTIGRRKTYLLSTVFNLLAVAVLFVASQMPLFLVSSVFLGVGRALSSGAMDAYFVDAYNDRVQGDNLQGFIAKLEIFSLAGVGAGSFFGGLYPDLIGFLTDGVWGMSRYSVNAGVSVVLIGFQILLTLIIIEKDTGSLEEAVQPDFGTGLKTTFTKSFTLLKATRVFRLLLSGALVLGLGISILEQLWQPQVQLLTEGPAPGWILGFLTAGYFFSGALGSIVIGFIGKSFSNQYRFVVAALRALAGGLLILLALQAQLIGFGIFYFLIFFTVALLSSPQATLFHRHTPAQQRSTLLSVESLFFQAGGMISSILLAAVAELYTISTAWIIAGAVLSLSALLYLFVEEHPENYIAGEVSVHELSEN